MIAEILAILHRLVIALRGHVEALSHFSQILPQLLPSCSYGRIATIQGIKANEMDLCSRGHSVWRDS